MIELKISYRFLNVSLRFLVKSIISSCYDDNSLFSYGHQLIRKTPVCITNIIFYLQVFGLIHVNDCLVIKVD